MWLPEYLGFFAFRVFWVSVFGPQCEHDCFFFIVVCSVLLLLLKLLLDVVRKRELLSFPICLLLLRLPGLLERIRGAGSLNQRLNQSQMAQRQADWAIKKRWAVGAEQKMRMQSSARRSKTHCWKEYIMIAARCQFFSVLFATSSCIQRSWSHAGRRDLFATSSNLRQKVNLDRMQAGALTSESKSSTDTS